VPAGQASISPDILARYAIDAACEIDGVLGAAGRRGARIRDDGRVELRLEVGWGTPLGTVGRRVQEHVRTYLQQWADLESPAVEVVVERIGPLA
jgi:uncharacterized alkaline shock family protein YloU